MNRINRTLAAVLAPAAVVLFGVGGALAGDAGSNEAVAKAAPQTGQAAAAAETEDKKVEREVKVIVRSGEGEPAEIVVFPEEGEGSDEGALFVGGEGEVETLPGGEKVMRLVKRVDRGPRGFLGVALTDLSPELRAHFGAPEDAGVMVARVEPDSPAEGAGLAVGDVITAIDGERVATGGDVRRRIRELGEGETAAIEVRRGGKRLDLTATIVLREVPEIDARRFLWRSEEGPGFAYQLDPEAMSAEIERITERLSGPEFQGRVQKLQLLEGDLGKRLDELEAKIRDLERQLAESRKER